MSTPLPPGILEALQIVPGTTVNGKTFQEVLLDLTLPRESEGGVVTNKYDLLCPRGCRSIILKRGVGQLVERSGIEVRLMDSSKSYSERQLRTRWILLVTPLIPVCNRSRHHLRRCNGGLSHHPQWNSRTSGFLDPWLIQETI